MKTFRLNSMQAILIILTFLISSIAFAQTEDDTTYYSQYLGRQIDSLLTLAGKSKDSIAVLRAAINNVPQDTTHYSIFDWIIQPANAKITLDNSNKKITLTSDSVGVRGDLEIDGNLFADGGFYNYGGTGDINNDGGIYGEDYVLLHQYLDGNVYLTREEYVDADVNGDGKVNLDDLAFYPALQGYEDFDSPQYKAAKNQIIRSINGLYGAINTDTLGVFGNLSVSGNVNIAGRLSAGSLVNMPSLQIAATAYSPFSPLASIIVGQLNDNSVAGGLLTAADISLMLPGKMIYTLNGIRSEGHIYNLGNFTNDSVATFNDKVVIKDSLGVRGNIDVDGNVITKTATISNVELSNLDNVSSNIQTQLNSKSPTASPTFTGNVTLPSTTNIGNISSAELSYLDNATSNLQAQIDNYNANTGNATQLQGFAITQIDPTEGKILVYRASSGAYVLEDKPTTQGNPAWGEITGTLGSQTDLQTALNGKAATSHSHTISNVTGLQDSITAKLNRNAANSISEAMLKIDNAPIDEYVLSYEQSTGNFEWKSASAATDTSHYVGFNKVIGLRDTLNAHIISQTQPTGFIIGSGGTFAEYSKPAFKDSLDLVIADVSHLQDSLTAKVNRNAANSISEAMLKIDNAPTDEYVLSYEQSTGNLEWKSSAAATDTTHYISFNKVIGLRDSLQSLRSMMSSILDAVSDCCNLSDNTPPNPVTYLIARPKSTSKDSLTWTASTSGDVDRYLIYRKTTTRDSLTATKIDSVNFGTNYYVNSGLSANTVYWYWIKAVDDSGNVSAWCVGDSAKTFSGVVQDTGFAKYDAEDGVANLTITGGAGNLTSSTDRSFAGTHSYKVSGVGGVTRVYAATASFSPLSTIWLTYRVYIPYGTSESDGGWNFLTNFGSAGDVLELGSTGIESSADTAFYAWQIPFGTPVTTNWLPGRWHKIEVKFKNGTGNAQDSVWIDEDFIYGISTATETASVTRLLFGAYNWTMNVGEAIYFDDIILSTHRLPLD